ncbi:hypothetical protein Moror_15910 [Moniliophthora roreri MCA 2997]|uniref:Uncharacterized protein n=2 Tax=Moniliophthora roreri TaxID=221103 RepID=V2XG91_MONRO|nr:hypothetical protein Moror_15910 [Moniliophthora roreri MCA 2997]KAI3616954.1 hypothetical protein WG66_004116 [Moniliophthora roreri]
MTLRRLDLHVSALSDAEYSLYTSSLADITLIDEQDAKGHDDAYYEELTLSLREARAWLKGRYSHVPAAVIDNILRFFSPNLSQTDILSGGQFFAALRLIVHAESGKEVDRGLAFVQAHPTAGPIARPASPFKRNLPPTPSRRSTDGVLPTSSSADSALPNPFTPPPQHPSSNNPFTVGRAKSNPGVPPSSKSHDGTVDSTASKLPPLPPRKPSSAALPPPRHSSLASTSPSLVASKPGPHSSSPASVPPAVPPKPSHMAHVTSTLMKQSLQASKAGQTMKKAEEQLERERVLQVLKSSAKSTSPFSQASSSMTRSSSPGKRLGASSASASSASGSDIDHAQAPPLPSRKKPSPPTSTSSFQQVALASTSSSNPFIRSPFLSSQDLKYPQVSESPSTSPTRKNAPLPTTPNTSSLPPPKHPDQSYRKPPPPIPPSLETESSLTADGQRHKRSPSGPYTRPPLHSATTVSSGPFELVDTTTGSKSASPYVSAFDRMTSDSADTTPTGTPLRRGTSGEDSPTLRLFRSKSLHHPSPTSSNASPFSPTTEDSPSRNAPPPPVRKKRPESVQVLSGTSELGLGNSPGSSGGFTRHMSIASGGTPFAGSPSQSQSFKQQLDAHRKELSFPNQDSSKHTHDPLNLKSLAASLQPQFQHIQPKLDKARFKAEAGLSRRGFLVNPNSVRRKGDQEGLMSGQRLQDDLMGGEYSRMRHGDRSKAKSDSGVSRWEDNVVYSDSSDDETDPGGRGRSWIAGAPDRSMNGMSGPVVIEKDNLKWPVEEGEGWRRL